MFKIFSTVIVLCVSMSWSTVFAECETKEILVQPTQGISEDNEEYIMINIPGFQQNATVIECLSNQTCEKGTCQQTHKYHQFLTLPANKQQFELSELKLRFFKMPYGCKCSV